MVAKFLDLKKPWSCKYGGKKKKRKAKLTSLTFLCMIVTGMFSDSNIARLARVFWGERARERARKPRT